MKRLHSIERQAFRNAEKKLWETDRMFWYDLRYFPRVRNQLIANEIRALGYDEVTWVRIGQEMVPQVFV